MGCKSEWRRTELGQVEIQFLQKKMPDGDTEFRSQFWYEWKRKAREQQHEQVSWMVSHVPLFVTTWTIARLLLSMKYSRQEYWSGLLFSTPGNLPKSGMEPVTPVSHGLLGGFYTIVPPGKPSNFLAAAAAKSLQSCTTLCNPLDSVPPGSPVPGILQAGTLEWVAMSFSNAWKVKVKSPSWVRLLATPWTAAHQAPPSTGFSSQEYWNGMLLPSPKQLS